MLNMKWTLSAVMLAGAFAGMASAQSAGYRGTFTLPFEARFGNTVLQPGNYTVATLEGAKGLRITGDKEVVSILAAGYDVKPGITKAKLILVDSDGMYALQSFESGAMGKTFNFPLGKHRRGAVDSASARPAVEVGMQ